MAMGHPAAGLNSNITFHTFDEKRQPGQELFPLKLWPSARQMCYLTRHIALNCWPFRELCLFAFIAITSA